MSINEYKIKFTLVGEEDLDKIYQLKANEGNY